jgi:ATP-dependent helicase/nuclease subunit A
VNAVRVGIVDLASVSEPAPLTLLDDGELEAFERRLSALCVDFLTARSTHDFPGIDRSACETLRCGFIRACHGGAV